MDRIMKIDLEQDVSATVAAETVIGGATEPWKINTDALRSCAPLCLKNRESYSPRSCCSTSAGDSASDVTDSDVESKTFVTRAKPQQPQQTTVIMRNLPLNYTSAKLLQLLNKKFAGAFDFFYMPFDFKSSAGLGYAFINFVTCADAARFKLHFNGFCDWKVPCQKKCVVEYCRSHQGLEAHIQRYRNSEVMHESIADKYKPMVFVNGVRAAFPAPTLSIRAPVMK